MSTNLVLLPTIPQSRFPQIIHDRLATHLVIIKVRDVIVFTLKRLARSILALSRNLTNALGIFKNEADPSPTGSRDIILVRFPERGGQIVQDG